MMVVNGNEIGDIVRFHRKRSGLSQSELARIAGVGKTAVFDIEKGKNTIQLDTIFKIFRALNVHVDLQSPLMESYLKQRPESGGVSSAKS